ncbi:hypothetical protein CEP54_010055 [Fusarium duplospermum]|uniref:Uncharacterized protein n=1 Tax=Fusarium duplospermum TaxID=1325734 RepID=A0A428PM73_9HYPO|nr:hypothetical protein CEP54_010055 [Fusarium duplospermum]
MSKPNPQSNSPLVKLPREVRDAIYLEVWRLTGLRQHIVAHWGPPPKKPKPVDSTVIIPDTGEPPEPIDAKPHYCRWKCCTDFEVEDGLQEEVDQLRIKEGLEFGDWFGDKPVSTRLDYQGLLSSPWDNHWKCWVKIVEGYGREYDEGSSGGHSVSTSGCRCWKDIVKDPKNLTLFWNRAFMPPPPKPPLGRWKRAVEKAKRVKNVIKPPPPPTPVPEPWTGSPYMPLLLCCKLLSPEIIESLYKSTTFIFTDIVAWQLWLGYCDPQTSKRPELRGAPRDFLEHTRSIELGLHPTFKFEIPCTFPAGSSHPEQLHDPFDFHWLKLDKFQNLRSLKIWMSARTLSEFPKQGYPQRRDKRLDQLSKRELEKALSAFDNLDEFIISTPLTQNIGPEDGYVRNVMKKPNHQVWKRGTGDHFHPFMDIDLGSGGPTMHILSSSERTVTPWTTRLSISYSCRWPAV